MEPEWQRDVGPNDTRVRAKGRQMRVKERSRPNEHARRVESVKRDAATVQASGIYCLGRGKTNLSAAASLGHTTTGF